MLESIAIQDLRGYGAADLAFGAGPHLVVGPNAAGKTSLLEAIALLGWGRSHRTTADGELIRWGHDLARVEGRERIEQDRPGRGAERRPPDLRWRD